MDALEALRHHCLDTQQLRAFGGPVPAGAGAVFLTGKHHGRRTGSLVAGRGVKDGELVAGRRIRHAALVQRPAAFFPAAIGPGRKHQVFDAHIGKGAAHHDFVVAAARAVGVEVFFLHTMRQQPLAGG